MRRIMFAFVLMVLFGAPTISHAQSVTPNDSAFSLTNPWVVGGAVVGVVAINAVTGGAMLAPMVGPVASNVIGGSWFGPMALSVGARQVFCRTTTLLAGAAVGAGLGYWVSAE